VRVPRFVAVAVALVTALLAAASAAAVRPRVAKSPESDAIARGPALIADAVRATAAPRLSAFWGGPTGASTGETVTIYFSDSYPQDPAVASRWADFFASLVHGSELASLTVYLEPLAEVQRVCGPQALACYDPGGSRLIAPGDDPSPILTAEAVVTHEYGHHVAAHRLNLPWRAVEYGTKRWATYLNVCARTAAGELRPGAETLPDYQVNPGEAFAEAYRVLNERRAGLTEPEWMIVSTTLYPDDTALALVEQDVTSPWQASTLATRTAALSARVASRTYSVATPLDGTFRVTLRAPAGGRFSVAILSAAGARLAAGPSGRSIATTVCGQRSFKVRVSRVSGAGTFRLLTSAP
jgi:hypothetical protein